MGNVRDFIYGAIEGVLIRVRRFRESGQLPNELKRRGADFIVCRRRAEVMKCFDGSAHEESLTADSADENGFSFFSTLNSQPSTIRHRRIKDCNF